MTYWLCEKIGRCEKCGPHNKDYFLAAKILEPLNMCKNYDFYGSYVILKSHTWLE